MAEDKVLVDEATLFRVLKVSDGNREQAVNLLNEAGVSISRKQLAWRIRESKILSAYFGDDSSIVDVQGIDGEAALMRLPSSDDELPEASMNKIVEAQDNYLMARGLQGVGFDESDIQEMESMAQFVGHGFKKTVDMTHGIMVTQLWKLHKRADEIREILNNNEETERFEVTEKGEVIRYRAARFTDAEKLEWQKEYTNIVDQIRRISDSAHQGAAIRLKAEMASNEANRSAAKKATKKRLKRVSSS